MLFLIFLGAALLSAVGLRLADKVRGSAGPRPEGLAFIAAVLVPAFIGLYFASSYGANRMNGGPSDTLASILNRTATPTFLYDGGRLLLLAFGIYLLSSLRGLLKLPYWVADIIVIGAAFAATKVTHQVLIEIKQNSSPDSPTFELGPFATVLTVLWIWLVSRLCASLNRVPAVAGGYLGLLGFTILLLVLNARSANPFASISTASLAGAGLMAFVMAFRNPQINLGWSSILAMGYLMGVSTSIGLLQDTVFAMFALAILALGLPLLNVSIVKVRAKLRGHDVEWTNQQLRLDQALANRGVPPRKIALYYFSIGAWLCLLAYISTRAFFGDTPIGFFLGTFYALILIALAAGGSIVFFSLARIQMRRQPEEDIPESIEAFGVKISPVSMTEALDKIEGFIATGTPHHVLTSDANAILTSRQDEEYANIMRRAAMITPDGFGVIWGARLLNLPIYERVTGVDMVTGICERAAQKGYGIFIFGSAPGTAATAAQNLEQRYPGLRVVGTHHGMIKDKPELEASVVQQIRDAKPDVLFVAMGIPLQEKFIAKYLEEMNVPVSLGVGGSFDVYSGKFNRAPVAVQRIGLEWLYRVWIEPSRWKRMGYVPKFMLVALKTWLFGPRNGKTEAF